MRKFLILQILWLSIMGGCESPDFRYPDVKDHEKFLIINHQQQGKDSVWTSLFIYSSKKIGDTSAVRKSISIFYEGEKKVDTFFRHGIGLASFMKTPTLYSSGLEVRVNNYGIDLPLPVLQNINLEVDSSWIVEMDNDVKLVLPIDESNKQLLDSFCVYRGQLGLTRVVDPITGDVNNFNPGKLYFLSDFVIQDSLLSFPDWMIDISRFTTWNELSKPAKREAINNMKRARLHVYHISSIRQFQRESPAVVNSASPFRIPENINPLDDEGMFYGEFTAVEMIKFK